MRNKKIHAEMFQEYIRGENIRRETFNEHPKGTCIEYLNKDKNYSIDTMYFSGENMWESAVDWGRNNIDNFTLDMINYL
tara:strand:+ start:127 stop:363 length:237 start_codon:yes stop_codon:yes gene_type:complete